MSLQLNDFYIKKFIKDNELSEIEPLVEAVHKLIEDRKGAGSDFLGWVNLPANYDREEFLRIKEVAEKVKNDSDVFIVIGIGGSYLGARAIIEALNSPLHNFLRNDVPKIFFVGNDISATHLNEIIKLCEDKEFSVNIISKSGTTTEPAVAFRVFKELLEKKYGKNGAKSRIFCTTDKEKGKLKSLAVKNGYEQFVVPDDVGGRFSVLTAVGLLPIAVSGIDIDGLIEGALKASNDFKVCDIKKNICYKYAAIRNILYRKGKLVEMLVSFEPSLLVFNEWFKQLFGESEGKDEKGIFPSSAIFSTDLHSLGQYIQDGHKMLFETVINIKKPKEDFYIKPVEGDFDELNYLADQNMSEVTQKVLKATVIAHTNGNVPNIVLEIEKLDEFEFGYLIYFFEKACAMSGYMLGVNPFNQPGVESYKKNMFALLGKPGFDELRKKLLEER